MPHVDVVTDDEDVSAVLWATADGVGILQLQVDAYVVPFFPTQDVYMHYSSTKMYLNVEE